MTLRYMLQASVWTVFLIYFIVDVATAPQLNTGTKILAYVLLAVFVTLYILSFGYIARATRASTSMWVGALALVMLACLFLVGGASVAVLLPYVVAVAAFRSPLRTGMFLIVCVGAVFLIGAIIRENYWHQNVLITAAYASLALARYGTELSERRHVIEQQLTIATERERVARDVHDILGHTLTVINLKSELAAKLIELDPARAATEITDITQLSHDALTEVRSTVTGLRAPTLDTELAAATQALKAAHITPSVDATVNATEVPTPNNRIFAWALRETTTNIIRHSGARHATITITPTSLSVRDDGRGIGTATFGNGLTGLSQRVAEAGGSLSIRSENPGTTIDITLEQP